MFVCVVVGSALQPEASERKKQASDMRAEERPGPVLHHEVPSGPVLRRRDLLPALKDIEELVPC